MTTSTAYLLLIGLTALERLAELVVSRRNAAWSFARGGIEVGTGHFPYMVVLHTLFLVACPVEVLLLNRGFTPWLGGTMVLACVGTQALRWWCITSLGRRWNTRVIIIPGMPPVQAGPYRFMKHPNYAAVVLEGLALPLVHNAWWTAIGFTVLNAWMLKTRIACENTALERLVEQPQ